MDDLLSLTNSLKEDISFQQDLQRRASEPAAAPSPAAGGGDDDDEEPSWLTEASETVAATANNGDDEDEPSWLTEAAEDAFTPQLLDTLARLDHETSELNALAEDEEPEWLMQAGEAAKHIEALPTYDTRAFVDDLERTAWDETAAIVQGACMSADDVEDNTDFQSIPTAADAGALAWLNTEIAKVISQGFPHLERLVSSPSLVTNDRNTYARELLKKRDVLLLRERQAKDNVALPVVQRTLSSELRREEAQHYELRRASIKQAKGYAALHQQLELTKSAAEATSSAARTIVDDHERDVAHLLSELRKHASADVASQAESKLSASLHQLTARKRRAQAEANKGGDGNSTARKGGTASGVTRAVSGGASKLVNAGVRSFSFGRKRDKERGVAVGVTGAGNGGLQTAELSLDNGAVMVEQPPSFEPKAPPARSKVASMSFNRARSAVSSSSSRGKERAMAPAASVIGSDFVVIDDP